MLGLGFLFSEALTDEEKESLVARLKQASMLCLCCATSEESDWQVFALSQASFGRM